MESEGQIDTRQVNLPVISLFAAENPYKFQSQTQMNNTQTTLNQLPQPQRQQLLQDTNSQNAVGVDLNSVVGIQAKIATLSSVHRVDDSTGTTATINEITQSTTSKVGGAIQKQQIKKDSMRSTVHVVKPTKTSCKVPAPNASTPLKKPTNRGSNPGSVNSVENNGVAMVTTPTKFIPIRPALPNKSVPSLSLLIGNNGTMNNSIIIFNPVCEGGLKNMAIQKTPFPPKEPHKCDICGKGYRYNSHLIVHKRTHTGESPFQCNVCLKQFRQKGAMLHHMKIHSDERPYKCDICGKCVRRSCELKLHMRFHSSDRPYKCDVCGKGFVDKTRLKTHMRIHTGEKLHTCNVCSKSFNGTNQLALHMRTHTGEKPYKCDTCGRCFNSRSNWLTHRKKHSGETPYTCHKCGKSFCLNGSLAKHMSTHLKCYECGESFDNDDEIEEHFKSQTGPCKCDVCGKCLKQSCALEIHMRKHTNQNPYKCDVCGKDFRIKCKFIMHIKQHKGDMPFICGVCGLKFMWKSSLMVHMRIHTGKNNDPTNVKNMVYAETTGEDQPKNVEIHGNVIGATEDRPMNVQDVEMFIRIGEENMEDIKLKM